MSDPVDPRTRAADPADEVTGAPAPQPDQPVDAAPPAPAVPSAPTPPDQPAEAGAPVPPSPSEPDRLAPVEDPTVGATAGPPADEVAGGPVTGEPAGPGAAPDADPSEPGSQPPSDASVFSSEPVTFDAPSPEEDEALRAERARRFGAERPGAPVPLAADDTRAMPADAAAGASGDPNTAELSARADDLVAQEEAADTPTHPVTPLPASPASGVGAIGAVPATRAMPSTPVARVSSPAQETEEEDPFAGFNEGPESRAAAHWWVVLVALVFVPVAWYLLADGGERLAWSIEHSDQVNVWAYVELGGGVLAAIIVLLAARWSSVGPIIMGSITALIGAAYLAVPDRAQEFLADYAEVFTRLGQFGQNVLDHLQRDAMTGRLFTYGVFLIMAGVISHGARRQGRREERTRLELEG